MGRITIGISAWADTGLIANGFYPVSVNSSAERLAYYCTKFDTTEINSTYHTLPLRVNLSLWLDNSPRDFKFQVRAYSLFTGHPTQYTALPRGLREKYGDKIEKKSSVYAHHLPPDALDDLWSGFQNSVGTINSAGKLGSVLFQFPPWFHPGEESSNYLITCKKRLPELPLAVEFRSGSWFNDHNREPTLSLLRQYGIALVCVDEPQGFSSSIPIMADVTAPLAFLRFHGRNAERWERKNIGPDEKYAYLYSKDELQEWLPRVREMAGRSTEFCIIFKNKHLDYPVRNALQLRELLGQ